MLRVTSNSLTKSSGWKKSAIYSSVKNYSTPDANPAPAEKTEKPSLSQRLGGSGRGKIMEGSSDPFSSFLANARNHRNNNNNNRNGNFTPRERKPQHSEGQFADAVEQRPRYDNSNNVSRDKRQHNNRRNQSQQSAGTTDAREPNNNLNKNRRNNNNNKNAQNAGKRLNLRKAQQPQEVRTRRATTFINEDIDWSSFDTTTLLSTEQVASETVVASSAAQDSDELVLKDMQGDYDRYLSIGADLTWPQMIQGATLNTLVGSNPAFDLQQKTAFLAALSNATNGRPISARK